MTIRTAFDEPERALGCEFMEWEGWQWPNHFGDPVAEHEAVRNDVGVWDESPLRKWDFRGPDALRAADRIFTNDMSGLAAGQIRYAPFCDADGKMVGDGTVFKFDDEHAWVITALDSDLAHFEEVVTGLDVAIEALGLQQTFETANVLEEEPGLDLSKLARPTSTWTYMVNDNPLSDDTLATLSLPGVFR